MLLSLRESPALRIPSKGGIRTTGKVTKVVPATNRRDPDSDNELGFVPLAKFSRNRTSRNRNPQAKLDHAWGRAVSFCHCRAGDEIERNRKTGLACPPTIRRRFRAPFACKVQARVRLDSKSMADLYCRLRRPFLATINDKNERDPAQRDFPTTFFGRAKKVVNKDTYDSPPGPEDLEKKSEE
jgi:hypothetical protein